MVEQNNVFIHSSDITWKTFVREIGDIPAESSEKTDRYLAFQGKEAMEAYEEIINEKMDVSLQSKYKHCKSRILSAQTKAIKPITLNKNSENNQNFTGKVTVNAILKAVERKDWTFLLRHVTQENVNLTDNFGWTPLMSASYCGHLDIIEFLLNLGANMNTKEKSGLTAAHLALKKNYLNIVTLLNERSELGSIRSVPDVDSCVLNINADDASDPRSDMMEPLKDYGSTKTKTSNDIKEHCGAGTGFYCNTCNVNFHQTTWKKHETSILHIFNSKPKLSNIMYGISKQNKGYKMLLKQGWLEQGGLGPLGKGMKFPIKTCLKLDRKGLGQPNDKKYRVTHWKVGDITLINDFKMSKPKYLKKKDRERLLNWEVRKEKMKFDQERALKHIQQVEERAGEILTDRQEIVALDKRRNDDRVGMRALQKEHCKNAWLAIGPMLLKMPVTTAQDLLARDQTECNIQMNKIRSNLKVKVNELRDLELISPVPGLTLQPISHKEMSTIKQALGYNS